MGIGNDEIDQIRIPKKGEIWAAIFVPDVNVKILSLKGSKVRYLKPEVNEPLELDTHLFINTYKPLINE